MLAEVGIVEVRVTAPDAEVAASLARVLVEERLAACVQVVPGVVATYRWAGSVETEQEVLLLAKTTAARVEGLRARVRDVHPYDVPEILAVPVVAADPAYAAWLTEAVTGTT